MAFAKLMAWSPHPHECFRVRTDRFPFLGGPFQWRDRGAEMKTKQWRGNDYAAVIVGLLFVIAILFSFSINDWVMHTFVWD